MKYDTFYWTSKGKYNFIFGNFEKEVIYRVSQKSVRKVFSYILAILFNFIDIFFKLKLTIPSFYFSERFFILLCKTITFDQNIKILLSCLKYKWFKNKWNFFFDIFISLDRARQVLQEHAYSKFFESKFTENYFRKWK
jgi:hypothetical protein